jgi:peroxiredoxin
LAGVPGEGDKAPDFAITSLRGKTVRLSEAVSKGPVVLVVLRGYPGYQCPICNWQVQEFLGSAQGFSDVGAQVVMVYPGPPQDLGTRAQQFTADKKFPGNFELLLVPGYEFTNLYGLRWDAPRETAYPSTFLIDQRGVVSFAKISKSHGDRTRAANPIELLKKKAAR